MILLLRKIRRKLLQENRFTRYLAYAFGEIILVVIGILIALQISNWNQERQEQASLEAYLTSISRNIESDLKEINSLRASRQKITSRSPYLTDNYYYGDNYLSINEIIIYSETAFDLMNVKYFLPDMSGYESLKNSGFLNKLQGQDLELLLYRYHNMVEEIKIKEDTYNEVLKEAAEQFRQSDLPGKFFFTRPKFIESNDNVTHLELNNGIDKLQQNLIEVIEHKSIGLLFNHSDMHARILIAMYDNLQIIGMQLQRLIKNKMKSFDNDAVKALGNIYDFNAEIGYPVIMSDGADSLPFYAPGYAQAVPSEVWSFGKLNEVNIRFKEMAWGVHYSTISSDAMTDRPSKDFSVYKSLRIEAKAPVAGQTLLITIKDSEDPDDGSETRVPLTLSTDWAYYDIPLSEFKTADLTKLFMPIGFVFEEKAQEVSIRHIEYLK